jgi:ComF family protein
LCDPCRAGLPALGSRCGCCAAALPHTGGLCGQCQRRTPSFAGVWAPYRYEAPLDWLIGEFKFQGRLAHARLLGDLLAAHLLGAGPPEVDCIVPVPLHPQRLRERGFNQAVEVGRVLARRLDLGLRPGALRRVKATAPQTRLAQRARAANVRGAFATREDVEGLRIALLDDVVTTAATAEAAALSLLRAGAARVDVWACARA